MRNIIKVMVAILLFYMIIGQASSTLRAQGLQAGENIYEANKKAVAQFYKDYDRAQDKLSFLLNASDSPYDAVLYLVALDLVNYDDPRSIAALNKLLQRNMKIEMVRTVADAAQKSLDTLEFAADKKILLSDPPLQKQREIIRKYAITHNRIAKHYLLDHYFPDKIKKNPRIYVPLLIINFAYHESAQSAAKKYPELTDQGLNKCLNETNASIVGTCITLIGAMKKYKYMNRIHDIAFEDKGNIDYKNNKNAGLIRYKTKYAYFLFGVKSIPYLEKILYSKHESDKLDAIGSLDYYGTAESLGILKKYQQYLKGRSIKNKTVVESLERAIARIQERNK